MVINIYACGIINKQRERKLMEAAVVVIVHVLAEC
jgi:hypothetical protein